MTSVVVAAAAVACGSSSDGDGDTRGGEGATCVDGTNCRSGLACFVQAADSVEGECRSLPGACGGKADCGCLKDFEANCTTSGSRCRGILGDYTIACGQDGNFAGKGEACSGVRLCDPGLFCMVASSGTAGTCMDLPASCGTKVSCSCFDEVRAKCSSSSGCTVLLDQAVITCD